MNAKKFNRVNIDAFVESDPKLGPFWKEWKETNNYEFFKQYYRHPVHSVYDYVFYGESSFWNARMLTSMRVLRRLLEWGDKPFYAADLLPGCSNPGAEMHKMHLCNLIRPTGNTRMVEIQIDDNLYKKFPAKEWELNLSTDDLCQTYVRIKNFIIDEL